MDVKNVSQFSTLVEVIRWLKANDYSYIFSDGENVESCYCLLQIPESDSSKIYSDCGYSLHYFAENDELKGLIESLQMYDSYHAMAIFQGGKNISHTFENIYTFVPEGWKKIKCK